MAQKTNPISLRLQKTNKYFSSCWYSDYFYDEMSSHDFRIRSYIENVLDQIGHSWALLYIQNQYKKVNIYTFLLDARGIRHEKEQFLRLPRGKAKIPCLPIPLFFLPLSSNDKREKSGSTSLTPPQGESAQSSSHVRDKACDNNFTFCRSVYASSNKYCNNLFASNDSAQISRESVYRSTSVDHSSNQAHVNLLQANFASSKATLTPSIGVRVDQLSLQSQGSLSDLMEGCINKTSLGQALFRQLIQYTLLRDIQKYTLLQHNYWNLLVGIDESKIDQHQLIESKIDQRQLIDKRQQLSLNTSRAFFNNLTPITRSEEIALLFKKCNKTGPFQELIEMMLSIQSSLLATLHPIRIVQHTQNGQFLIGEIVYLLQKRVSFRQIKDQIVREAAESDIIKGIRLSCSGRLAGRSKKAQKSKTQSTQWGETSLHVLSSKLSFTSKGAITPFGKVGIKLWICYK